MLIVARFILSRRGACPCISSRVCGFSRRACGCASCGPYSSDWWRSGSATVGAQRSGAITLSLIDGVEQLETYFGQFLPQFLISLLTPLLIFAGVALIDLPVAAVMLGFALVALFAPALWHRREAANS